MSKNKKQDEKQEELKKETATEENIDELNEANAEEELKEQEENFEEKAEKLAEENKKLKEDYLRAFADAENTKRRCQQEIEKNNKYAISSFAKELLSVADNLQRAIDASSEDEACKGLLDGVKLTQNELTKVFDKFGIKKMEILGTKFDPNFHQVIQEVPNQEKESGTIIAEIQTGYMIKDRILREAMVVVTKK